MDDVGVPRSRVPEMLAAIERISAAHGLPVGVFGHAGDGNLHPTFVVNSDDPTAEARINTARAAIYEAAIALGGTITGEHGTGHRQAAIPGGTARGACGRGHARRQGRPQDAGHLQPRQGAVAHWPNGFALSNKHTDVRVSAIDSSQPRGMQGMAATGRLMTILAAGLSVAACAGVGSTATPAHTTTAVRPSERPDA